MATSPVTYVRQRLARSIDWRVDAAVDKAISDHRAQFGTTGNGGNGPDALSRLESLETRSEQLDAALERLRSSITSLSVTLTDAQRSEGELLTRLAADVDRLTAELTKTRALTT